MIDCGLHDEFESFWFNVERKEIDGWKRVGWREEKEKEKDECCF
jgi:hypothetical protein